MLSTKLTHLLTGRAALTGTFKDVERLAQGSFFSINYPEHAGYRDTAYRVPPAEFALNLAPAIRDLAVAYFAEKGIAWHLHKNHGLSSQACCINFLMPLAQDAERLSLVVGRALGIAPPEMLPVEYDAAGREWLVAFEWNGQKDYLNEATETSTRTRGANSTSPDAAVRFRSGGKVENALIEWKYSESYGSPVDAKGNAVRRARYDNLIFAPDGPVRGDLGLDFGDFLWEPFYQMLRQQMLAYQMEKNTEAEAQKVRVIHISPDGNRALHKVTAPLLRQFGSDAFDVFRSLLVRPTDFISWSIEGLFGPLVDEDNSTWADYLKCRYQSLLLRI